MTSRMTTLLAFGTCVRCWPGTTLRDRAGGFEARLAYVGRLSCSEPLANPARSSVKEARHAGPANRNAPDRDLLPGGRVGVDHGRRTQRHRLRDRSRRWHARGPPTPGRNVRRRQPGLPIPRLCHGRSAHHLSDSRLDGYLLSEWNWDVQASGDRPIPAWGTISIGGENGSWSGAFSGIRQSDFEPVDVRAVLFGDGAYDGMCATLDISALELARSDTWVLDGIVHPVDMD